VKDYFPVSVYQEYSDTFYDPMADLESH